MNMGKNPKSQTKKIRALQITVLAAAMSVLGLAAGCSLGGGQTASVQLKPRPVQTEPVQRQKIAEPVEQVADAVAGTKLDIVPKASGEVVQVLKKRGEYVRKDEVILVLDSKDAQSAKRKSELALRNAELALQQAKDSSVNNRRDLEDGVKRAETGFKNAQEAYNKIRNDYDAGLVTQRQVDQAKQALDDAAMHLESVKRQLEAFIRSDPVAAAELQVESARLALEDATRSLEYFNIKSPSDGILTDFDVTVGQMVSAAAGPVGKVQQIDRIKIKTELTESQRKLVEGKQELIYYDPQAPEQKETAKIGYLSPIMNANTKTFTLELEIANTDLRIQPGKRYMVQLTTEREEEVLAVPIHSIIRENSNAYVFVQEGDRFIKRQIVLGRLNAEYQEVLQGLKEGELIVVAGQNSLQDGQPVQVAAELQTSSGTGK